MTTTDRLPAAPATSSEHDRRFAWRALLLLLLAVMLFPVRVYGFPGGLPVSPDPYRIGVIALLVSLVGVVLRRRFIPVEFGWWWVAFFTAMVFSVVANTAAIGRDGDQTRVMVALVSLAILLLVFPAARQGVDSPDRARLLMRWLVGLGTFVALAALVERVTSVNIFWKFGEVLPLTFIFSDFEFGRGGGARSYASAQHPIALAVVLMLILPVAMYLFSHDRRAFGHEVNRKLVYGASVVVLLGGIGAAVSRTAIVALAIGMLVVLAVRPLLAVRLGVAALPLLFLGYALQPKIISALVLDLFDVDAVIESQQPVTAIATSSRLGRLDEVMRQFSEHPWAGVGHGTRIVTGDDANSFILDNQYFGAMLDGGVIGLVALVLAFVVPVVALLRLHFRPGVAQEHADLALGLAVSNVMLAVSAYFFDFLAFIQVVVVYGVLLALAGWLLAEAGRERETATSDVAHSPEQ